MIKTLTGEIYAALLSAPRCLIYLPPFGFDMPPVRLEYLTTDKLDASRNFLQADEAVSYKPVRAGSYKPARAVSYMPVRAGSYMPARAVAQNV